jgi:hypothetical protein
LALRDTGYISGGSDAAVTAMVKAAQCPAPEAVCFVWERRCQVDANNSEEKKARLRREEMVDALVDCLALLERDGLRGTGIHSAVQQRVASLQQVTKPGGVEDALESYLACQRWLAQGLEGERLAEQIMQSIFASWPCEVADYQRRYDAFLEKELENPHAAYYPSSCEWMAAVDDLRDEVVRSRELGRLPSEKLVCRCIKLLHTQPPCQPGANTGMVNRPVDRDTYPTQGGLTK